MKPTLWLLGLLAATSSTASAALINIQSASLTKSNRNCNGSPAGPALTDSFGTVSISRVVNQLVAIPIVLKGTPNTVYVVRLVQTKPGSPGYVPETCPTCPAGQATFTTNSQGVGYVSVQETLAAGVTGAWVAVNKQSNCNDFFTSPVVTLP